MTLRPSIFGQKWGQRIANAGLSLAKLAGYEAGQPAITRKQQSRYNSNPNSIGAQIERINAAWNAEYLAKNSPFAIGYLRQRINYCTPQGWMPNTGDTELDKDVRDYCEDQWADMGVNCSMYDAFARVANVELPARGDAALVWFRDETRLRLAEVSADQIGPQYTFTNTATTIDGWRYFAGIYFNQYNIRQAFEFYDRNDQVYTRIPQLFPASDVLFFSDNLFRAHRGITIFHGTINELTKSDTLFGYGMDAAQKQGKTAVVVRNEMGAPLDELSYETKVSDDDGNVTYIERNHDGAATEYQYNGDAYEVVKTEAPGPVLIEGCRYADERSCQSLGVPYSWLVTGRFDGGAGYRGDVNKAGKELGRICKMNGAQMAKIAYVTVMDGYDRRVFGKIAAKYLVNLHRGTTQFPTGPTADAFRDTQDDIRSNRAGIESRTRILGRYSENWDTIRGELKNEAMDIAMDVQDANRELIKRGYEGTITVADIAQNTDNPQSQKPEDSASKRVTDNSPNVTQTDTAKMNFDESKHPRKSNGEFGDGKSLSKYDASKHNGKTIHSDRPDYQDRYEELAEKDEVSDDERAEFNRLHARLVKEYGSYAKLLESQAQNDPKTQDLREAMRETKRRFAVK